MPTFQYTARDRAGQVTSGPVDAETDTRAAAQLREMGLWVTNLRSVGAPGVERRPQGSAAGGAAAKVVYPIWSGVSAKDRSLMYRQLYTMVAAGMTLYQALLALGEQEPNPRLRSAIQAMAAHVLQGGRLSEVMARYPWIFSRLELRMIEAAEIGGLFQSVLQRLADYLER